MYIFFKRVEVRYARYFTDTYNHVGHVFQNRYKSEPIKSESHFAAALRYILRNPEAAGICSWEDYRWSSANSYFTKRDDSITDRTIAIGILGGEHGLLQFMREDHNQMEAPPISEPSNGRKALTEVEALRIFHEISGCDNPIMLQQIPKKERNDILVDLKTAGLSIRQIERITGINRNIIQRAK